MSAQTASIYLAPDLAEKARLFAENRHCSLEELAAEALSSYIGLNAEQNPEVQAHLQRAMELGLTPDEYAVRLVKEVRAEQRFEREA